MKLADIIEILSKRFLNYKIHELEKYNAENINVNFFQYIDIIGDMEAPTYGELAQKLNLSKPAITAIVNKLMGLSKILSVLFLSSIFIYIK